MSKNKTTVCDTGDLVFVSKPKLEFTIIWYSDIYKTSYYWLVFSSYHIQVRKSISSVIGNNERPIDASEGIFQDTPSYFLTVSFMNAPNDEYKAEITQVLRLEVNTWLYRINPKKEKALFQRNQKGQQVNARA